MSRLIDADALMKNIDEQLASHDGLDMFDKETVYLIGVNDVTSYIVSAPTVDAESVRHAHWVRTDKTDKFTWECSECGYGLTDYKLSYCYDCGAKMDEVTE